MGVINTALMRTSGIMGTRFSFAVHPFLREAASPDSITSKVLITISHFSGPPGGCMTLAWTSQCPVLMVSVTDLGWHTIHTWAVRMIP